MVPTNVAFVDTSLPSPERSRLPLTSFSRNSDSEHRFAIAVTRTLWYWSLMVLAGGAFSCLHRGTELEGVID